MEVVGGMDAVQLTMVSGFVGLIVQMIKVTSPAPITGRMALLLCWLGAGAGVALWVASQPVPPAHTWIFGLAAAWANIAAGALGTLIGVELLAGRNNTFRKN